MANDTTNSKVKKEASQSNTAKKSAALKMLLKRYGLPIALLIIVAVAVVYFYQYLHSIKKDNTSSQTLQAEVFNALHDESKQLQDQINLITDAIEELDARTLTLNSALQTTQTNTNKDYALAEIEHLLIIASYNLQLEHDVKTALAAMETADSRLHGLADSRVIQVRKQLIEDMNNLRNLNQADLSGLGLYLSDLINRVDVLPLKENTIIQDIDEVETESAETERTYRDFFSLVWRELKSLVVITHDTDVARARLLPDQVYFLKANIKLELANARFAVFNRDTENLQASIEHVQEWLNNYFDRSDASVKNVYDTLNQMKKMDLVFPEYDLSSSIESVRALMHEDTVSDADTAQ